MKNAIKACGYEFQAQPRLQIMRFVLLLGILILVDLIAGIAASNPVAPDAAMKRVVNMCTLTFGVINFVNLTCYAMGLPISLSMMFSQLHDLRTRTAYLMIPLRMSEKFVGQLLFYFGCFTVCFAIAAALSTFVATAAMSFVRGVNMFSHINWFHVIHTLHLTEIPFLQLITMLCGCSILSYASFFVTGSVFFPRFTFVKTFLLLYAINMVLGLFTLPAIQFLVPMFTGRHPSTSALETAIWLMSAYNVALIILNCVVAARRFRETDII